MIEERAFDEEDFGFLAGFQVSEIDLDVVDVVRDEP